ncbi:MAG TPA: alcohol dehydrogenase catalytic domain-containing protein [Candidatus Methylacidiphilales bacterium]|nr:alcohol dehydrogenase catalytic domain-containing protein [Candidatus Methylacidiphilales bacterium]
MKALCWYGTRDVRVEEVPEPKILASDDIIIKTSTTAICGSDLHLYHGTVPMMEKGDILGHEFMGTVVEKGPDVKDLQAGDRVIIPFAISCGRCFFCKREYYSCCDNTNHKSYYSKKMNGDATAGIFGYSHLMGGYAGGQAEYVRVPFANVGPAKVTSGLDDDDLAMLTDAFPTGYMAAENCNIQPGDTVAVWGCGPIGQFAIRSAYLLGAHEVIAIAIPSPAV